MKRKYADRPNWKRVLSRSMLIEKLETENFKGHAVLICIDKVREPLWVDLCGKKTCVVDSGYSWMTLFPKGKSYVVTAMFDNHSRIVQWYIDICKTQGFTADGTPWYDDLYLDIIVSEEHKVSLIDEDDLQQALEQKLITREDYDFAYIEANGLLKLLMEKKFELLTYSQDIYSIMKERLGNQKQLRKE